MVTKDPDYSILVTCHNEECSIEEFHERLTRALEERGVSYELIMVNDGSADGTWEKLKQLFEQDAHIHVVMDFYKNAGQQAAITACINAARGRAMVLIDSDLQLDPGEMPMLMERFEQGYDLVSGFRANRQDSFWRIGPSKLANWIMRRASRSTLSDFGCTFKVYRADLLRAFDFGPYHVFSNVDVIAKIERYTEIPVTHFPRKYGRSGWTFQKLWQYNMDNLVQLSQKPFQFLAGFCFACGVFFALRVLLGFFLPGSLLNEVTPGLVLNSLFFFALITLSALALLGELVVRNHLTLRHTPAYIVREILRRDGMSSPEVEE